jgi:copper transport protein
LPVRVSKASPAAGLAAAVSALVLVPGASAHAVLLRTAPPNDAVVETSPRLVTLTFDEQVESALGSIRVYDANARRVDAEKILRPGLAEVAVALEEELPRGTYTVTWRVISADSDPTSGAFVFHVEAPGPQPKGIAAEVLTGTPALVSILYTGGRFLDFVLLLLCVGGVASLAIALRSAARSLRRRLWGFLAGAAGALTVVALLGLPLQGSAAGGLVLGEAFRWSVIESIADTRFGKFSLTRAVLASALLGTALALRRAKGRSELVGTGFAVLLAGGLAMTPSFSGHASVSGPVSLVADIAHVLAAATWTGGLAFLVLALSLAGADRWPLAARSVPRFSTMAVVSVAVLIVAGAVNGYLQVRAWRGLWETTYGLLLLAKIALVVPLLALGAYNNRFAVPRLRAGIASRLEQRRFLRAAGAEIAVMVGIVAVTAVLVNAPQARTEIGMHGAATAIATLDDGEVHVSVEPATAGTNEIHLAFEEHTGAAMGLEEVRVSASLASEAIGPLRFEARPRGSPGEFVARNVQLPIAGSWQFRIEARRGEFELLTQIVSITIREEP